MGSNWGQVLGMRRAGIMPHHRGDDESLEDFTKRNAKAKAMTEDRLAALRAQVEAGERELAERDDDARRGPGPVARLADANRRALSPETTARGRGARHRRIRRRVRDPDAVVAGGDSGRRGVAIRARKRHTGQRGQCRGDSGEGGRPPAPGGQHRRRLHPSRQIRESPRARPASGGPCPRRRCSTSIWARPNVKFRFTKRHPASITAAPRTCGGPTASPRRPR